MHGDADAIVPVEHAKVLEAAFKAANVPSDLHLTKWGNHDVAGSKIPEAVKRANAFMGKHLLPGKH